MKLSENGLNLIKKYEGCRLYAYKPVPTEKYWTIGWGHYGADVTKGMKITQEQADNLFKQDLKEYEIYVSKYCEYLHLNQNQFDALVSFTYNCGFGGLQQLTQNKDRNAKEIAEHIEAYNKGGGKVLPGLVKRRKEEKELFLREIEVMEKRYQSVEELPEWAKKSVQRAVELEIVRGNGAGLNLSETEVKILVWLDRAKVFDF